jgi:hypothetical protein
MNHLLRRFLTLPAKPSEAVVTGYRQSLGYQQILAATLAAATPLTIPTLGAGQSLGYIVVQANGGIVRWRDDGTAPTASVGMSIPDGGELNYVGDFSKIKFILSTSAPILDISYYQ